MEPKFKKDDWCFCEFVLQQIQKTEDNRITEVSEGNFRMSSHDLSDRCFPLTLPIKRVSDSVDYWSNKFHALKHNGLNHPDLNRALINRWVTMCENVDDLRKLKDLQKELDDFGSNVCRRIEDLRQDTISEVQLFR